MGKVTQRVVVRVKKAGKGARVRVCPTCKGTGRVRA